MISESQDFFLQTHSPPSTCVLCCFLGVALSAKPIRACLSPYRRWRYGLFVALFRPLGSIRALGRPISPVGLNTGSWRLLPVGQYAAFPGLRFATPWAVFWRPFRALYSTLAQFVIVVDENYTFYDV